MDVQSTSSHSTPGHQRVRRVLIVDDNVDAGSILAEVLGFMGYEVRYCSKAALALEAVAALRPDVCVSDIGMPEMDGHELARHLRQMPAQRHLRLIALTGYTTDHDRMLAARAGFDVHLSKPVAIEALIEELGDPVVVESST